MATVYEDLELPPAGTPADDGSRPYVVVNMVASADGALAVSGKASGIGGEADRRAMRALRSKVDAVMVGAGTLRAEKLNLGLDDPCVKQPLAVIIAGNGAVPIGERLVRARGQRVLVLRPLNGQAESVGDVDAVDDAEYVFVPASGEGRVELRACLHSLRTDYGVNRLLVEGGPMLNDALVKNNLVDEYFLTVAPKLLQRQPAPDSPRQANNNPTRNPDPSLNLLSVHLQNGELFLRYTLRK